MENKIARQIRNILPGLFTVVLAGMTACTGDFEKINTNPGGIPEDMIPVESRFAQPMESIYLNYMNRDFEFQLQQNLNADLYSGYLENPTPFGGNNNNSTYVMDEGWNVWPFKIGQLNIMKPIHDILAYTQLTDYRAMAKIIRVAGMNHVTDTYGPVPYTNAIEGAVNTVPYDSQEAIYHAFFSQLKEAVDSLTLFMDTPEAKTVPTRISSFDEMCNGNYGLWIRFANTLRLRLAMRIVKVEPELARQEAEAAVNHPYGVLVSGDANIEVKKEGLTNPLQVISFGYNDIRVGAPYVCMLEGYNDPRLAATVKPVGWYKEKGVVIDIKDAAGNPTGNIGNYVGIRQGIVIPDKTNYIMYSVINMDADVKATTKYPLPVMKVAEAYFLRAEGALRGWNMGGTAQSFYEAGILQSFYDNGITDMGAYNTYITDNTNLPSDYVDPYNPANNIKNTNKVTIQWNDADNRETNLQRIITQKWIAMFPEGQEAWSEFRRTGYPKLFPVADNRSDGIIPDGEFIKRLPFTRDERNTNLEAVEEARKMLKGPDNINTRVWWDVDTANF